MLNKIVDLAQKQLEPGGFDCIDVEWVGGQRILRVFIDQIEAKVDEENMDITDCVKATRALNEADLIDQLIEGSYTLEVSSPGLERPLRSRSHFEQFLGSQIKVKLTESYNDRKAGTGKLLTIENREDSDFITIETARGSWEFPLEVLAKANIVYEWNKA